MKDSDIQKSGLSDARDKNDEILEFILFWKKYWTMFKNSIIYLFCMKNHVVL